MFINFIIVEKSFDNIGMHFLASLNISVFYVCKAAILIFVTVVQCHIPHIHKSMHAITC